MSLCCWAGVGFEGEPAPDDHARLAEPTKSLQQVEAQPESLEPQWAVKVEPVIEEGGVVADKPKTGKILDTASPSEAQPVSTENIIKKVRMSILLYWQVFESVFLTACSPTKTFSQLSSQVQC